jgi:hypothetical protein
MRFTLIVVVASCTACAGTLRPASASRPNDEALIVLPGFGYGRAGERSLGSLAPTINRDGIDLYVADYLTRGGLASSRSKLERFIHDNRLDRYRRVHVFAFIAGAWTVNPLIAEGKLPNLGRVIYDRSPFQERAPAIAVEQLRLLAWLRYGSTIFELSRTSYAPLAAPGVDVALVVESVPTTFIKRHATAARALGAFAFDCAAFNQSYRDCGYIELSHDELYTRFAELWPDLLSFIRTGRFSAAMDRTPPTADPLNSLNQRSNQ